MPVVDSTRRDDSQPHIPGRRLGLLVGCHSRSTVARALPSGATAKARRMPVSGLVMTALERYREQVEQQDADH